MIFTKPSRIAEANIQAEFYHQCKLNDIECYLEYKYDNSRFDAVIVKEGGVLLIVEFKSYKTDKRGKQNTKQLNRYRQYGIPVFLVTRIDQISNAIEFIRQLF